MIVIGVDTHKRTHALAAVDEGTGRLRGKRTIEARDAGHLAAVRWARELDEERVWAIEDCRHVSRRLEQALIAAGERVIRVSPRLMGASRKAEREPGKSDEIDSLAIARAVVREGVGSFPIAYLDEQAMRIRLLSDHRQDLVAERTRTQTRLRWHLMDLCPELEAEIKPRSLSRLSALERLERQLRRLPACERLRIAREELSHIRRLTRQIDALEQELKTPGQSPPAMAAQRDRLRTARRLGPDRPHRRRAPVPLRLSVRQASRRLPNPLLLRTNPQLPTQPWRGPPTQQRAPHHRRQPRPRRPPHQGIPRTQTRRRQNQKGGAPLPQAHPRQPLPPTPSPTPAHARPHRPQPPRSSTNPHRPQPHDLPHLIRPPNIATSEPPLT
jgi:transposase